MLVRMAAEPNPNLAMGSNTISFLWQSHNIFLKTHIQTLQLNVSTHLAHTPTLSHLVFKAHEQLLVVFI